MNKKVKNSPGGINRASVSVESTGGYGVIGDKSVKPGFAGFGELIGISIGLAAIAWVLDSILDSIIFHDGTLIGQLLSPTAHEIGIRVLFGFVLIVFGTYTQLNTGRSKWVEEELRQSEEKYRMLIENIQEGVFIIQDTKFQYVNEAFARTSGYKAGEITGRNFKDLVAPEDFEMVADRYSRRQAGESVPDEYEFHVMRKDGTRIVVNMNVGLVTYRGRVASMGILKDITGRKQVEEALKEATVKAEEEKNKSEAIIASLGDGIIIQDTDYKILYQNQVQNDLYGNHIGEYCYKVYEGRDTICEDCPVELSFRDGKIHKSERCIATDRGTSYFELTGSPLRDSTGKIIAGIKVVRDITGLKRTEEELRKGERFLASIFASIQDGIGIIDKDMNILRVNPTAESWYPHTEYFVGRKCYEAYHGRSESCEVCPARETLKTGESAYATVPKHGPGGKEEVGWLEIYSYPMIDTATGEMRGVIEYVRDITERRRVEEELAKSRMMLIKAQEIGRMGSWEWDITTNEVVWSKEVYTIYGLDNGICKPNYDLVLNTMTPASKNDFLKAIDDALKRRKPFEMEYSLIRPDGARGYLHTKGEVLYDSEGHPLSMYGMVQDITERKKVEEKIRNYTRELEESNRMKELFTDIMHHDLLNPLTTANGFIELLKENETISRKKACLETIERSLVKGMELIDSAMKFSRFESLKTIELEELDLKKIIEEVIEALIPLADNAGMEIVNRITFNMPVRANKIIEEVFSNLISNAIKYASSGKRIIIESENKGENLQVRIIDFGEGIKESDKTMIFERFRRGGKTGVKGSGLGLAIAGKIMELHNGRIWVEDNPEGGAIFIVEIPK